MIEIYILTIVWAPIIKYLGMFILFSWINMNIFVF